MLTRDHLFHGELLHVRQVRCRPAALAAGAIEQAEADAIVLPVRGVFTKHLSRRRELLAEPTRALFFAAGRPYRISHPSAAGDDCLVLQFAPQLLREATADAAGTDDLKDPRVRPHVSLSPPALVARDLLRRRLVTGSADPLEVEETSLALLASVVRQARDSPPPHARRDRTRDRRRQQADAVRRRLLAEPANRTDLPGLARLIHTTPWHLARLFRAETGVSIHQYRLRVRLDRALTLLLDTDRDLTRIALDLGFSSHSHFSAAFRSMTGLTPTAVRRGARAAVLRKLRTLLTAPPPDRP